MPKKNRVKVVGKSEEEKKLEAKLQEFIEISKPLTNKKESGAIFSRGVIWYAGGEIVIFPERKEITLNNKSHYGLAFKLAEIYERKTEEEWTIQKRYE